MISTKTVSISISETGVREDLVFTTRRSMDSFQSAVVGSLHDNATMERDGDTIRITINPVEEWAGQEGYDAYIRRLERKWGDLGEYFANRARSINW